jgi:hypothetical protein
MALKARISKTPIITYTSRELLLFWPFVTYNRIKNVKNMANI